LDDALIHFSPIYKIEKFFYQMIKHLKLFLFMRTYVFKNKKYSKYHIEKADYYKNKPVR